MKMTKLSLATIIAIGSISCANAQNLEDAIKNVEISGTAAYRYNDYEGASDANNNYKIATNLKSSINDDLTFNSRIIIGDPTKSDGTNPASINTDLADTEASFALSEVNFSYSGIQNTIVTAGKQAVATPFTVSRDAMGNEQTGTGLVANTNLGMVSLTGGYFNQTNFDNGDTGLTMNGSDVYFAAGSITLGNVVADAAYVDVDEAFDAYTFGLKAKYDVAGVELNPYARYSALNLDNSNTDNSLWKIGTDAQMGIFGAYVAYGETNEEGGTVGVDASSDTGMDDHWRVTLSTISDASVVYASVNTQVTDAVNVSINYSDLNAGSMSNSEDQNEIYGQVSYQMSKNFKTFARFGQYEYDGDNSNMGRLHAQYSF